MYATLVAWLIKNLNQLMPILLWYKSQPEIAPYIIKGTNPVISSMCKNINDLQFLCFRLIEGKC